MEGGKNKKHRKNKRQSEHERGQDIGEGGHGRGRGIGEGGHGRGRGIDEGGHGRGRGIGEGGHGRGRGIDEGGHGRGRGIDEGGHGRGRGIGEGGHGRGRGIDEGGHGRGRGIDEGGHGRGRGIDEGGHGRGQDIGEGGHGRGRGIDEGGHGRGRGVDKGEHGKIESPLAKEPMTDITGKITHQMHDMNLSQKQKTITPKKSVPHSSEQQVTTTLETGMPCSSTQKVTTDSVTSQSPSTKLSLATSVADQLILSIPRRTQLGICGTLGRPITVEVNMMPLEFNKIKTMIAQYDVTIIANHQTVKLPKNLIIQIFEAFRQKYFPDRYPAFDGRKIAYSGDDLPFNSYIENEITIFDNERQQQRVFTVKLTKVKSIDLSFLKQIKPGFMDILENQSGMQALEVILRSGLLSSCVTIGRSLFPHQEGRAYSLSNGMELWVGSFSSTVLGWKPYVNIDVVHKAFPKSQGVIEYMREICCNGSQDITQQDVKRNQRKIEHYLKKLKVHYEIPNLPLSKRTHEVNGLVECPRNYHMTRQDGTKCTIEEYFQIEKKYSIRYPLIPCLWLGSKNKTIYVPPELCTIIGGQVTNKKLDDRETASMIKFASRSTTERKQKIMNSFNDLRMNYYPTMTHEFNFSVSGKFEKVPARVLNPPILEYNNKVTVNVLKGVWHCGKFLNACTLEDNTWTIINLGAYNLKSRDMYYLREKLQNGASSVGMFIGQPIVPLRELPLNVKEVLDYFTEIKQKGVKLVIVIISERDPQAYSIVKQITELQVGVLTQCLKSVTVEKKLNNATIGNILLKINSKLNGTNHKISTEMRPKCLNVPCMLVGADVTHPPPDAQEIPSIAAVTASFDPAAFKYNIELRLQPPKTEIIQDLTEIMCRHLIFFRQSTKHVPQKIIFFRDGVSEGQIPQVLHYEISAIRNAFRKLCPDGSYSPPITFLIVQKRHHIRLFPTSKSNSDDRNYNVQAGTIVDTHITHPTHIDFYLVSHASIQGTARPTKYKCICNECNMTEDEIEQLTYYLCHMFSRCTRSVSYPAPTYYAHLAAFRARALIQNIPIHMDRLDAEQKKIAVRMQGSPMFYV